MTYVYGYSTIASLVASQTKNAMPRQLLQYSPLTKAQFDIQMLRLSSISKLCIVASRQASRRTQFVQPRFVTFSFVEEANQNTVVVDAKEGKSVLDIAIENNIDIEGACGGELACSTCHVITTPELFAKLPPKTGMHSQLCIVNA